MVRLSGQVKLFAQAWSTVFIMALGCNQAFSKPHEHGVAEFELSQTGQTINIRFSSPLDSFLGFERAPRNEQEKSMYRQLRQDLGQYGALITIPVQAACTMQSAEVGDPHGIETTSANAKGAPAKSADATSAKAKAGSEHHDMVVEWQLRCEAPGALKRISFQGFDRYKRLRRVDAVFNTPSGLGKARLTSRQRDLQLP